MVAHFRSIPSLGFFGGRPQFKHNGVFSQHGDSHAGRNWFAAASAYQPVLALPLFSLYSHTSRAGVRALPLGATTGHERLGVGW